MRRRVAILLTMLLMIPGPAVVAAELKPLTVDDYPRLIDQHAGQSFLLVLWSVDCAPCHKELAMLGGMLEEHSDLPVTLISTDQHLAAEQVLAVLERHGVEGIDNWQFADPVPARLRQAIDPDWYGTLPRSYFFRANGERVAHSGLMSVAMIREQLNMQDAER